MRKPLSAALALALGLQPSLAAAQSLRNVSGPNAAAALKNQLTVNPDGSVTVLNGPKLGVFQNGRFTSQPDALQIGSGGATGPVDGASVTPNTSAPAGTLAKLIADRVTAASPVFTGTATVPAINLTGSGSTGDVSGLSVTPGGGVLRTNAARADDCVNVLDRGAVADLVVDASNNYVSGTDNTAAFQAAINRAITLRRDVCVPGGAYYLAGGITADLSATTIDTGSRPAIRGAGRGTAWLRFGGGNFSALTYKGGTTGAAPHTHTSISGLRIDKTDVQGIGLDLQATAFLTVEDVKLQGFDIGISGVDVLSSRFRGDMLVNNRIGAIFARGSFSYPNSISFENTDIGSNNEVGLYALNPTTLSVQGAEVGGNGCASTAATRGGIVIVGGPAEGGVGLVSDHVYYEGNCGQADINIVADDNPGTYTARGNTFNRTNGGTNANGTNAYVNSAILAIGSAPILLDVRGNAFKRFNTYTASSSRPYVNFSGASNAASVLEFSSTNLMDDPSVEGTGLSEWKSWTPTIGAASGAITASTITGARYRQNGKTVNWEADFTITTNGTGAGALTMTLPVTPNPAIQHVFAGQSGSGAALVATTTSGTGTYVFNYAGVYPGADGTRILLSGTYEAQ